MAMRAFLFCTASSLCITSVVPQWQPDLRLTNDPGTSYTPYCAGSGIATVGNEVHVVWYDSRDGDSEIYYKRSTDGGLTWGIDTRLSNAAGSSEFPTIVASGPELHVFWGDGRHGPEEIYYRNSTDGGTNWGAETRLTNDVSYAGYPSAAVSGQNVHVSWEDDRDGNLEIYGKRSTDGGVSWGADVRLTNNSASSENPSMALSASLVQLVWNDDRDGNNEVYYKRSTDGGVTWGADTRLTNDPANGNLAMLSTDGSGTHVVWYDERDGNREIYYLRSTDAGLTWGAETRLTNDPALSSNPMIVLSGTMLHLFWHDERDGNREIYYNRSLDGGLTWDADTRLTNAAGNSGRPSVSVSGQVLHLAWYDERDGNPEVYYTQNPTGNVVGIDGPSGGASLFTVYPNPARSVLNLAFAETMVGGSLTLTSLLGETVHRRTITAASAMRIDLPELPDGMYFLAVDNGQGPQSRKVEIER